MTLRAAGNAKDFPQIRSVARNLIAIAGITVCCGMFTASVHGEIHTWPDLFRALYDGLLYGVVTAFGWLGMSSPLAKYVQGLLHQDGAKITVEPSGKVTVEKTTTVETPPKVEDVK